jgi:alpha-beta hydrolase superfamily lysophospholipase
MKKNVVKRLLWVLVLVFVLLNVVAFNHAYHFTHFSATANKKTGETNLSTATKLMLLFTGVSNPKPVNKQLPQRPFQTIKLPGTKDIECWLLKSEAAKGTVILFHGYGGEKSSMLDKAEELLQLGYDVLLADFMGSGGSEGLQTTIGFKEAEQVKRCFNYLKSKGEKHIHLFGTSMGAVAILKAIHDYNLHPTSIIIECPFGTLYQTVCARFQNMGVPIFPMAGLLVFWGGVQNGFWAFSHNPVQYARSVRCPALLLYGEKDPKVSRQEIESIYANLGGPKQLHTYPNAGHENYLIKYKDQWRVDVRGFLDLLH